MGRKGRRPLRVLAVDDSTVMRGVLRILFDLHEKQGDPALPPMELCGLVRDGVEGLEAVRDLEPDVLLLDIDMPRMDGLKVLEQLRYVAPQLPVIVCSGSTEPGARATFDALARGAKDFVMKSGQQRDLTAALGSLMQQLMPKIAALSAGQESSDDAPEPVTNHDCARPSAEPFAGRIDGEAAVEIVVIAVSTGGPSALEQTLPMLPRDFPVPVMIVQHMPKVFTGALADRLNRMCRLSVEQARDAAPIKPGTILLAPGDTHMEVSAARAVRLHQGPPLNSCMPSADYLLRSAAEVYGAGTLALVMTGMGADGLEGARCVKQSGGTVLAQDERTSAVWGMPGRVVKEGLAAQTVALPAIADVLIDRVHRRIHKRFAPDHRREGTHAMH